MSTASCHLSADNWHGHMARRQQHFTIKPLKATNPYQRKMMNPFTWCIDMKETRPSLVRILVWSQLLAAVSHDDAIFCARLAVSYSGRHKVSVVLLCCYSCEKCQWHHTKV